MKLCLSYLPFSQNPYRMKFTFEILKNCTQVLCGPSTLNMSGKSLVRNYKPKPKKNKINPIYGIFFTLFHRTINCKFPPKFLDFFHFETPRNDRMIEFPLRDENFFHCREKVLSRSS